MTERQRVLAMLAERVVASQEQTCYRLDLDRGVMYEGENGDLVMFIPEMRRTATLRSFSKEYH